MIFETGSDPFLRELVDARNRKGWTQQKLADELGMTRTYIAMVETGKRMPSAETARLWARKVGIDEDRFEAWVRSRQYPAEVRDALTGMAEYTYWKSDPSVRVEVASHDQIRFESAVLEATGPEPESDLELVPLIPEGEDPDSEPVVLDCVSVQRELLQGERLVRPFGYRLSAQGAARVSRTLRPGDYAIVSRDSRPLERAEIYAVRLGGRIVLSRVLEKGSILLLLSDQGEQEIDALHVEDGNVHAFIVGKVVAAVRPLQYTVVKPGGRRL